MVNCGMLTSGRKCQIQGDCYEFLIRNVIGRKNRTLLKMQAGLCEGIPPFFRERRSGCGFLHDEFDSEYIY